MTSVPPANKPSANERRKSNRRPFQGTLEIEWGAAILTASTRDISPGGLFVELTPPLWVGATFSARLLLNPVLKLHGTVRRVEPGKGIAIAFDLPEESGKLQLEKLLETLPLP
jgi:hypothetical protein